MPEVELLFATLWWGALVGGLFVCLYFIARMIWVAIILEDADSSVSFDTMVYIRWYIWDRKRLTSK